eukprot:TRINITY_DN2616_c0_g1_i1.p8 TRINITY_DN2616_c0_g1~~TRINITY_DN2616_c0_g1_i1.p8  ORF type:complete len:197 (-),score=39.19 TRINITY_DN2616_c0_g1_i1:2424-3014(-)
MFQWSNPQSSQNMERSTNNNSNLSKEQILNFIEEGHKLLDDPDVKRQLKAAHENGQNVEKLITQLQKEIFQKQGIDGDVGIAFLAKVSTVFADDPEVLTTFFGYVEREDLALDEVELEPNQYMQKLQVYEQSKRQRQQALSMLKNMNEDQKKAFLQQQQQMAVTMMQQQMANVPQGNQSMSAEEQRRFLEHTRKQQ